MGIPGQHPARRALDPAQPLRGHLGRLHQGGRRRHRRTAAADPAPAEHRGGHRSVLLDPRPADRRRVPRSRAGGGADPGKHRVGDQPADRSGRTGRPELGPARSADDPGERAGRRDHHPADRDHRRGAARGLDGARGPVRLLGDRHRLRPRPQHGHDHVRRRHPRAHPPGGQRHRRHLPLRRRRAGQRRGGGGFGTARPHPGRLRGDECPRGRRGSGRPVGGRSPGRGARHAAIPAAHGDRRGLPGRSAAGRGRGPGDRGSARQSGLPRGQRARRGHRGRGSRGHGRRARRCRPRRPS